MDDTEGLPAVRRRDSPPVVLRGFAERSFAEQAAERLNSLYAALRIATVGHDFRNEGTAPSQETRPRNDYLSADAEAALEVFNRARKAGIPAEWAMEDAIRAVRKIEDGDKAT